MDAIIGTNDGIRLMPGNITIRITVQTESGGVSVGVRDTIDDEGVELAVKSVTHVAKLPKHIWVSRLSHLAERWCGKLLVSEPTIEVTLRAPTALFAAVICSAFALPVRYTLTPRTQISYLVTACMLRDYPRILQCQRFIAQNFSTASFVHAMRAATSPLQSTLLCLGYQWLRRTGGVTPAYILMHPNEQVLCDVDRGLLSQGKGANEVIFDIRWWLPLVTTERQRKRRYYVPREKEIASEAVQRVVRCYGEGKLFVDNVDPSLVDSSLNVRAVQSEAAIDATEQLPSASGTRASPPNVSFAGRIALMEVGTLPLTTAASDSETDGANSSDATSKSKSLVYSGPGVGFPGLERCYIVRRRDGRGPCRVLRSAPNENLTNAMVSPTSASTSASILRHSSPNGEEWDGIVAMVLGSEGGETSAMLDNTESFEANLPWLMNDGVACNGLVPFHRTPFDHQELDGAEKPPSWPDVTDRPLKHAPCPLHDGSRPVRNAAEGAAFDERRYYTQFDDYEQFERLSFETGSFSDDFDSLFETAVSPTRAQSDWKPRNVRIGEQALPELKIPTADDLNDARMRCTCSNKVWAAPPSTLAGVATAVSDTVMHGKKRAHNSFGSRHVYELRREKDDALVMVAAATSEAGKFVFSAAEHLLLLPGHASKFSHGSDPDYFLGSTQCNLLGTCITVFDFGLPVDPAAAKSVVTGTVGSGPALSLLAHPQGVLHTLQRRELCRIMYDTNIFASAPNTMTVELRHHDDYDRQTNTSAGSYPAEINEDPIGIAAACGLQGAELQGPLLSLSTSQMTAAGGKAIPSIAMSGALSAPSELDLRAFNPSTGFGYGVGSTSGAGSWSGMLSSAWNKLVGPSSDSSGAVTMPELPPARTVLMTRKPVWDERIDAWTMDFKGRATKASKKNFQLVAVPLGLKSDSEVFTRERGSSPALLCGKVAKDRFSLDFDSSIMGPYQAFAIALSTFASKLAVA